jgi:hypothetical protein
LVCKHCQELGCIALGRCGEAHAKSEEIPAESHLDCICEIRYVFEDDLLYDVLRDKGGVLLSESELKDCPLQERQPVELALCSGRVQHTDTTSISGLVPYGCVM